MEMYVDHQLHLVSIWLPNDEKDVTILEPVYRKYKGTPYRVAVFRSGKGNLLTNTAAIAESKPIGKANIDPIRRTSFLAGLPYPCLRETMRLQ